MKKQTFALWRGERDWSSLLAFLRLIPIDEDVSLTVSPAKRDRSDLQNRALWGVAYKTLSDATGNDPDDLHTYFCGEFFSWIEFEVMGQIRKRPYRSTTKDAEGKRDVISTDMLSDFYAFIQRRSAETVGVYVPDPDPMWFTKDEAKAA